VPFEPAKITIASMKAFLAVHGAQGAASASVRETVEGLTQNVVKALMRSRPGGGTFHIEDVQDQVELSLMRGSHHEVARAYVLYRERRTQERAAQQEASHSSLPVLHVLDQGVRVPLDLAHLKNLIATLRKKSLNPGLLVMVGGPLLGSHPHLAQWLGADFSCLQADDAQVLAMRRVDEVRQRQHKHSV
jgi:hypothetical protein